MNREDLIKTLEEIDEWEKEAWHEINENPFVRQKSDFISRTFFGEKYSPAQIMRLQISLKAEDMRNQVYENYKAYAKARVIAILGISWKGGGLK